MSGQRIALIVANGEYEHEGLRDLLAPAADAEALGRVLGDPQIGDFTVQVVRNQPAHVISAQIEEMFSESHRDDVLLLHYSGHGLKSESGELFFAASNTRPNRLGSTAVSADFVQRCMRASRSRSVVLLLDCCYGGAFAQGVTVRAAGDVNVLDSFPQERAGGGRGRAVITASNAMEFAFEGDQLGDDQHHRPSVFTSALVKGLATGEADRDEDGWISLNELYYYIFDKVREQNPNQTPSRQVDLEGELYLARSRRERIRLAPLPPDLAAALADPNMYTRLGAVSELRSRLASDNLPAAAGAYEALAELVRTDIRYIADPAAAALEGAAVHPEETELDFGHVEQGSPAPHRTIRLAGLPIARACVPHPSEDWIHADPTADGIDIWIDTTHTGHQHGTLDLKGPTGETTITIHADLTSPRAHTPPPPRDIPIGDGVPAPAALTSQPENQSAMPPSPQAAPATEGPQLDAPSEATTSPQHDVGGQGPRPPAAGSGMGTVAVPSEPLSLIAKLKHTSGLSNHFVLAVALSSDGHLLASAGDDRKVRLWELTVREGQRGAMAPPPNAREHVLTGHTSAVRAVAFSPDGQLLASAGEDKKVRLWDPVTGECVRVLTGHTGPVRAVAFSPDGQLLASAGEDKKVRLWDSATGDCIRWLTGHTGPMRAVVFSPDGQLFAGADDDRVRLWDPVTGESARVLTGHTGPVRAVVFSPDGRLLASAGDDKKVWLWEADDREGQPALSASVPAVRVRVLTGHTGVVRALAFTLERRLLASAGDDRKVRLWDPVTGECVRVLTGYKNQVLALPFSPDNHMLVTSRYGTVQVWC